MKHEVVYTIDNGYDHIEGVVKSLQVRFENESMYVSMVEKYNEYITKEKDGQTWCLVNKMQRTVYETSIAVHGRQDQLYCTATHEMHSVAGETIAWMMIYKYIIKPSVQLNPIEPHWLKVHWPEFWEVQAKYQEHENDVICEETMES